jgi:hypothetical protein
MEALLETMELMANPKAMAASRRDRSGKGEHPLLSVPDEREGRKAHGHLRAVC